MKLRKVNINENQVIHLSITPMGNDKFELYSEAYGERMGIFSKQDLLKAGFSEYQLNSIKGTTNFRKVK